MTQLLLAAVVCAMSASPASPPQPSTEAPPPPSAPARFVLGARAGFAFPLGTQESERPLDDEIARAYPLELWAGWKITPEIEAGLLGGYAPVTVGSAREDECRALGVSCDAHLWRVAARGEYSLRIPNWVTVPWGSATLGWEWAVERWEESSSNWSQTSRSGWLVGFEAGFDRPFTKRFEAGLFAGVSFGQYRLISVTQEFAGSPTQDSGSIQSPAVHGWLSIGLRGAFKL